MKYCPKCETRYDEGSLRFCTKDGSPLVEEEKPNFVQMPSESLPGDAVIDTDDPSELTVIRRNVATPPVVASVTPPVAPPPSLDDITFDANDNPPPRIIVPMDEEPPVIIAPRPTRPPQAYAPPQRSNTAIVVLLTIIGTTIILGGGAILIWLLQRDHTSANTNANFGTEVFESTLDPALLSGWGVRTGDWQWGASVQQEVLPRVAVELTNEEWVAASHALALIRAGAQGLP